MQVLTRHYEQYEGSKLPPVINICIWKLRYVQYMIMRVSLDHERVHPIGLEYFHVGHKNTSHLGSNFIYTSYSYSLNLIKKLRKIHLANMLSYTTLADQ